MEFALSTNDIIFFIDFRLYFIFASYSISLANCNGQGGIKHPISDVRVHFRLFNAMFNVKLEFLGGNILNDFLYHCSKLLTTLFILLFLL